MEKSDNFYLSLLVGAMIIILFLLLIVYKVSAYTSSPVLNCTNSFYPGVVFASGWECSASKICSSSNLSISACLLFIDVLTPNVSNGTTNSPSGVVPYNEYRDFKEDVEDDITLLRSDFIAGGSDVYLEKEFYNLDQENRKLSLQNTITTAVKADVGETAAQIAAAKIQVQLDDLKQNGIKETVTINQTLPEFSCIKDIAGFRSCVMAVQADATVQTTKAPDYTVFLAIAAVVGIIIYFVIRSSGRKKGPQPGVPTVEDYKQNEVIRQNAILLREQAQQMAEFQKIFENAQQAVFDKEQVQAQTLEPPKPPGFNIHANQQSAVKQ